MTEPANVPPPPRAGGCCGMGCLTLILLLLFLVCAFVGGIFWAVHHVKQTYSESQPIEMPTVVTSDAPAAVEPNVVQESAPAASATPIVTRQVETRWKTFEKAADRQEKARVELRA